jgi:hypothetical protein
MTDLLPIAALAHQHWPKCRAWPADLLLDWLEWYRRDGRMAIARDRGAIIAFGLARNLNHLDERADFYAHEDKGPIIWVDLAVARHPRALQLLWQLMIQRHGERNHVAFERGKSGSDRPHLYLFSQLNPRMQPRKG